MDSVEEANNEKADSFSRTTGRVDVKVRFKPAFDARGYFWRKDVVGCEEGAPD